MRSPLGQETQEARLVALLEPLTRPSEALSGRVALAGLAPLGERAFACRCRVPYPALAKALSLVAGGQWMAMSGGLVWLYGRQAVWLVEWSQVDAVQEARGLAGSLGVPVRSWTLGGVARALLEWTAIRQRTLACSKAHLGGTRWAYQACEPGQFAQATLCDLASAYHQVVSRLPSPKLDYLEGGPCWFPLSPEEAARWRVVKEAAAAHKGLRTRLLGCMIGGGKGCSVWCKGVRLPSRTGAGPLVTAGLLVARTVYELCALEAQASQALYANTDCVVTQQGQRRSVWERYGYAYRVEAEGTADLVALGCWRVADRQTRWYGAGGRYPVPYPADPLPATLTLPAWH